MATSQSIPATVDFVHWQGDTFRRSIAVADADITTWDWVGEVRRGPSDEEPTVEATFDIVALTSKEIVIELSASVTKTLAGKYLYDVQATTDALDVLTIIAGSFVVRPGVTAA